MLCSKGTQLFVDAADAFWQDMQEKDFERRIMLGNCEMMRRAEKNRAAAQEKKKVTRTRNQTKGTPPTGDWTWQRLSMMERMEKKEEAAIKEMMKRSLEEPKAKSQSSQKPKPKAKSQRQKPKPKAK